MVNNNVNIIFKMLVKMCTKNRDIVKFSKNFEIVQKNFLSRELIFFNKMFWGVCFSGGPWQRLVIAFWLAKDLHQRFRIGWILHFGFLIVWSWVPGFVTFPGFVIMIALYSRFFNNNVMSKLQGGYTQKRQKISF